MYILFEGIDTSGKSTQLQLLAQKYPHIITTKEPGGTDFGVEARKILLSGSLHSKRAELLLFLADRAEHYEEIIKPHHQQRIIISDRGFLSGVGYALANEAFDFDTLLQLNHFALEGKFPDKIILFQTNLETLKQRTLTKELDGIERRGLEYLLMVQTKMIESLEKMDIPYCIIDATDSIESIQESILSYLNL